jgi:hypothetical protein
MPTILETIVELDSQFAPDPDAVIWLLGVTPDGGVVGLWLVNDGTGPLIWPGPSCLGVGGVYFNPLIISVEEME